MLASHTLLAAETPQLVPPAVLTRPNSRESLALTVQSSNPKHQSQLPLKSSTTDQSKLPSPSIKTSSHTAQVSITTSPVELLVVTPLNFSVSEKKTELSTGSLLTHGAHHGE